MEITKKEFESIMAERGKPVALADELKTSKFYFSEGVFNWLFKLDKVIDNYGAELWSKFAICNDGAIDGVYSYVKLDKYIGTCYTATKSQISLMKKVTKDKELKIID